MKTLEQEFIEELYPRVINLTEEDIKAVLRQATYQLLDRAENKEWALPSKAMVLVNETFSVVFAQKRGTTFDAWFADCGFTDKHEARKLWEQVRI